MVDLLLMTMQSRNRLGALLWVPEKHSKTFSSSAYVMLGQEDAGGESDLLIAGGN